LRVNRRIQKSCGIEPLERRLLMVRRGFHIGSAHAMPELTAFVSTKHALRTEHVRDRPYASFAFKSETPSTIEVVNEEPMRHGEVDALFAEPPQNASSEPIGEIDPSDEINDPQLPETVVPESQVPESQVPESQVPESQVPESQEPESQEPEIAEPEAQQPEIAEPKAQDNTDKLVTELESVTETLPVLPIETESPLPIPEPKIATEGEVDAPYRIMLLGDSITSGIPAHLAESRNIEPTTSYRPYLWRTIANERPDLSINFVGASRYNTASSATSWQDLPEESRYHASFPGYGASTFLIEEDEDPETPSSKVSGWADASTDVALILLGVNDLISRHSIDTGPKSLKSSLQQIVQTLRKNNPSVEILLGTIPEMSETLFFVESVSAANTMIEQLVEPAENWLGSTAESPIHIVDHFNGVSEQSIYDAETHSTDGIHPNTTGDKLLAGNWWSKLADVLPPEPGRVSIRTAQLSIKEGETTEFIITRDGDFERELTVSLRTGGNADPSDFVVSLKEVVFEPGAREVRVELTATVDDNTLTEFDEFVSLWPAEGADYIVGSGSSVLIRQV